MTSSNGTRNPIIWADVPDPSVIRVEDTYYMSSTTMHMNPGVPIMKSKDLASWEIVNYVYDVLGEKDQQKLIADQNEYGKGSWASSLRYHEGIFYVVFSSQVANSTFIYKTRDIENGPWEKHTIQFVHDMSLLFDDDGCVYLVYGGGDIRILELTADATSVKPSGLNQVIIPNSSAIAGSDIMLPAEGAHIHKINNKYYIFLITWPRDGMRTVLCYRADTITGPWEGRIVLQDSGIAQGGLIDTPDGKWYALLFGDRGAVGRIPYLVPVTWEDNWPIFGIGGKVPQEVDINKKSGHQIVSSDEFERQKGDSDLGLAWQWNHNPDNENWSLTERQGFLRLRTSSLSKSLVDARNTLTQRTFGPECSGIVAVEISEMRVGDYAGLAVLQKNYGFVGVKMSKAGKKIIMMDGSLNPPVEVDHINVEHERVYFKIACDFREQKDLAYFYYSLDGKDWVAIGSTLKMTYTIPHFMGYRFALFNFSTEEIGGYVDFDYFRLENSS